MPFSALGTGAHHCTETKLELEESGRVSGVARVEEEVVQERVDELRGKTGGGRREEGGGRREIYLVAGGGDNGSTLLGTGVGGALTMQCLGTWDLDRGRGQELKRIGNGGEGVAEGDLRFTTALTERQCRAQVRGIDCLRKGGG